MNLAGKRILIISPHPDDEAIGCGGLIMAAKGKADTVVFYLCVGESPRQLVTGFTGRDAREREIEKAAEFGQFWRRQKYDHQLLLDMAGQVNLIDAIEDEISTSHPDIICLPFGGSYNQDHRAAFTAGIAALRPVPRSIRHFVPAVLVYEEPYSWGVSSEGFKPNFYLPLTPELLAGKLDLLACHASQVRADPFPRSSENLTRLAGLRGAEIGVGAAEAYMLLRGQFC